jgi:hypothetical protein
MNIDYVIVVIAALALVVGAGLFRVGLMHLKGESPRDTRRAWLLIAIGIALGIAAVLILVLRVMRLPF